MNTMPLFAYSIACLSLIPFVCNSIVVNAEIRHISSVSTPLGINLSTTEENRVSNGDQVEDGEATEVVYIEQRLKTGEYAGCTGTLLSPRYVVTAGHCVTDEDLPDGEYPPMTVYAGSRFPDGKDGKVQRIPVLSVSLHKDYDHRTSDYDVAVLKILNYLRPSETQRFMQLGSREEPYLDNTGKATIYGWGMTDPESLGSDELLRGDGLNVIDIEICKTYYNTWWKWLTWRFQTFWVGDTSLCVEPGSKQHSCQGDSGGPLIRDRKLIGISSWGPSTCDGNQLKLYTKVSAVWNFINKTAELGLDGTDKGE